MRGGAPSFYSMHGEREDVRFTIMDNSSQDGAEELEEDSRSIGIEFRQSGFVASEQQENSHGEALRQFVMENPECEYYLLLDADLWFIMAETVDTLVNEITDCDDVWAVHARSRRSTDTSLQTPTTPTAGFERVPKPKDGGPAENISPFAAAQAAD